MLYERNMNESLDNECDEKEDKIKQIKKEIEIKEKETDGLELFVKDRVEEI